MTKPKLFYFAHIRFPTQKAHGIQISKMCEAFAMNGITTTLVIPRLSVSIKEDPFHYYNIKRNFSVERIPVINILPLGKWAYILQSSLFYFFGSVFVFFKIIFSNNRSKIILYTRDEQGVLFLAIPAKILNLFRFNVEIFWEVHMAKNNLFVSLSLSFADKIIFITQNLRQFYLNKKSEIGKKSLVLPDGVDIEKFDIEITKEEARKKIGLPLNKKIILYTGHLYQRKGAQTLADASDFLENDYLVVFVGGLEEDIIKFRNKNRDKKNILVVGHRPYNEIPLWLKSADVLVIPSSGSDNRSKLYNSPMKLFEYMASKRPIIASDVPALREILGENNALLVEPDNTQRLAEGIKRALNDLEFSRKITQVSYENVKGYSWHKRAKNILNTFY